jgi:hypothetical protein
MSFARALATDASAHASRTHRARAHRARHAGCSTVARASSNDGNAAALDLLERLQRAYETDANGTFVDAVLEAREHLTLLFFDVAEERVRSLEASGDASAASALDEACAAIAARAQYTVDEIIASASTALPEASGDALKASCSESGLTTAQDEEIRRRWGAMTGALATTGEENAVRQLALNQNSRRNAITEIVGRAQIGAKEFESLKAVAPERRIADVLLTIPRGAERAAAVEDALTPPVDGESVDGDEENEVVFTTAPRLLNVLEGMMRKSMEAGEDASELVELIQIVETKCDFF